MGIIQRQSVKSSIINYFGIVLGAISTLFIYPLDWEVYGGLQYWISSAVLLVPILRLGSTSLINKYFPYFRKNHIKGFLSLIIVVTISTITAMSILLFTFRALISDWKFFESIDFFNGSFYIVYSLSVLMIFANVLQQQAANHHRIVVPDLLTIFSMKLVLPALVLLSFAGIVVKSEVSYGLILYYVIIIFALLIYVARLKALDLKGNPFKSIDNPLRKDMTRFWLFGGLNYFGTIIAYKIDAVMIGSFLSKTMVGYYSIFLFIAAILEIPFRSINRISGPIISQSFEREEFSNIESIYKKASRNLLINGVFMFSIIWLSLDHVFEIMTNGEDVKIYKNIFLLLGLSKLFDMMASVNHLILVYSKWYRYNLLFLLLLGASNLTLNYIFIDRFGIIGAAYATAISIFSFNVVKSIFIYVKLRIHPFSPKLLVLILILAIVLVIEPFINLQFPPVISGIIIGLAFSLVFFPIVWFTKVSEEFNNMITKMFERLRIKRN